MRWRGTRGPAQPARAGSRHPNETALYPLGAYRSNGGMGLRTERRVDPSGPPRAGGVPLRRDQIPRSWSRPCLARVFQILKLFLGTHDIMCPSNLQTQDVGMRASIALGPLPVHGKTRYAIFVGEIPPPRCHSYSPTNYYFAITYYDHPKPCGQKRPKRSFSQTVPVARRRTEATPVTLK